MHASAHVTTRREIRFAVDFGDHTVATIAAHVGFPVTDAEVVVILDHVDRELENLARSVTLDAVHARIAELVRVAQRTSHASDDA